MSQIIQTNVASLNAQRNLAKTGGTLETALQRLSSGMRINSAKDDAAGLGIATRMSSQIMGMNQANRNANDAISLAQTGEGALGQMTGLLQRMRELAVQSANASNSAADRNALNDEVAQLSAELDRFAKVTDFNGLKLFDGTFSTATYQVGPNADQSITATTANFRTQQFGTNMTIAGSGLTQAVMGTLSGIGISSGGAGTTVYGMRGGESIGTASSGSVAVVGGSGVGTSSGFSGTLQTANGSFGFSIPSGTTQAARNLSAKDIADAINGQSRSGVTASARTEATFTFSATGSYTLALWGTNTMSYTSSGGNSQTVSFNLTDTSSAAGLSAAVDAFNQQTAKTGVSAKLNDSNNGIILVAEDGSNIILGASGANAIAGNVLLSGGGYSGVAVAGMGLSGSAAGSGANSASGGAITIAGSVRLDSDKTFSVSEAAGTLGGFNSSGGTSSMIQSVSTIDVSTVSGATNSLRIIDSALNAVSSQRAKFGALQNRVEYTMQFLQSSSENLSAARSRIQDADFAAETAALSKAQILQQAGTAMLAQANQLPNSVLSLLK